MPSCVYRVLWSVIGVLLCAIGMSTVLTLYLKDQSNQNTCTTTTAVTCSNCVIQTNLSVTVTPPYYCYGVSPYTLWTLASSGITMNINTSNCSFSSTPLYFVSLGGINDHWDLAGYTAIYAPTKNSFVVYGRTLTGGLSTSLLNEAQTYQWFINWLGISK